jgi:predicted MFS family arabinose efflux permease
LPISVFFVVIAASAPLAGVLVSRLGTRWVFMLGAVPAVLGYVMVAGAATILDLLLWRCVTAVGYAFITIACQGYLGSILTPSRRAGGMAVFVSTVMTGAVCGTVLGAILADRIGYRATFLVSAGLVAVAALLVWRYMEPKIATAGRDDSGGALRSTLGVLRNPRVAAIVVFGAMPARIVLTGFLFYIVPLFLSELGAGQPMIGRIMMIYGLAMLMTIHFGTGLSDRFGTAAGQITWAGLLTGLGAAALGFMPPIAAVMVALAIMGLCHGIASASMLAIVPGIRERETAEAGPATLSGLIAPAEYLGAALGPLIAAILVNAIGYAYAIIALGGLAIVAAVIFRLVEALPKHPTVHSGNLQTP